MKGLEIAEKALNGFDFDHPFRVTESGHIVDDVTGIYAPDVLDDAFEGPWEAVTGYSGQDSYAGPVMHNSEYSWRRDAAGDMLGDPGIYVQVPCYWSEAEDEEGPSTEGWMLLKYSERN